MALFAPRCPVSPAGRTWIESSLGWLHDQFGDEALEGEVFLPESLYPSGFAGSDVDLDRTVQVICSRMGASRDAFDLEVVDAEHGEIPDLGSVGQISYDDGDAGHYRRDSDRTVVALRRPLLGRPVELAATIAHEVGHVRLLGEGRISPGRSDGEQLTDLTAVFFGFGVFTANSAYEFSKDSSGWQSSSLGYLGERLVGYALACCAFRRGEPAPAWATALDTNPRAYLKHGLRYLQQRSPSAG